MLQRRWLPKLSAEFNPIENKGDYSLHISEEAKERSLALEKYQTEAHIY